MDVIERLAPWMYEFEFSDGTKTPLLSEALRPIHAVRRSMIFELLGAVDFDPRASVLDLACNEGFFSFEFARHGAAGVLGIDERPLNIEKAEYVRSRTGLTACRFAVGDVTSIDLEPAAADIVLLLGIIYHVEDPIRLMRRAAHAARRLLIVETQLIKPQPPVRFGWGSPEARETADAWAMLREDGENQLASTRGFSLVPSASAVVSVLRDIGFRSILQLHPNARVREPQYEHVDRAMFAAFR
ncbi:MAG TPA: class I SAM-dependent methyltransferase [Candidatus Elarobacter sp.]|nr:class I SAM-dependent methyltransferase [Candidatus Elarobacter sp.]